MKTIALSLSIFFFLTIAINAQNQITPHSKQIGITGLPIIYLDNGGFDGLALYGNLGWVIQENNVVGIRPFFGLVDPGFNRVQRLHSLGSNVYYRRYLNRTRWSFFVEANLGFGYIWYSSDFPDFDTSLKEINGTMFNFAFGPGLDYEIKNGLNIELAVQYLQMKNISHPDDTNVGNTIIPSIGIQKFF